MAVHKYITGAVVSTCLVSFSYAGAFGGELTTAIRRPESRLGARGAETEGWSREERANAKPLIWNNSIATPEGQPKSAAPSDSEPAGSVPGGKPQPGADREAKQQFPNDWKGAGDNEIDNSVSDNLMLEEQAANEIDFGSTDIFDSYPANKDAFFQKKYPWKAIGKLYFNVPGGGGASCTASVVSPHNIIVTAAHCCYTQGAGWHSNFSFVPAARNTNAPYGQFPWSSVRVLTAWTTGGGRDTDVCLITLGQNGSGKNVTFYTGWLGRSWNWNTTQHHFAFGYPGNIDSGKILETCSSESFANCGNGNVLATGCDMTYGSSGGPWLRVFKPFQSGAMNYVNSVVSGWDGACTGTFGLTFNGARFTSSNIVPLCNDEGC